MTIPMRYLITGKHGQLARTFARRFEAKGIEYSAPDESILDITDSAAVRSIIAAYRPDIVLNCAAYNLVDKAEQERSRAAEINAIAPGTLAIAAREQGARIVHFGSDYVFDGAKENGLYTEVDATNPLNEYGKCKLAGEDAVLREHDRPLVLRLSWVYGEGQQNFIHKLRAWAAGNEFLKIACDEFSVPTWTDTVVDITIQALDQGLSGRYHLTNSGYCSRYEWASLALRAMGIAKFIRPVPMDVFQLPAKRPRFSAMSNERIAALVGVDIPAWDDAVKAFIKQGGENNGL